MTKAQCDPNVANNSGQTPLHHEAEYLVLRVSFCVGNGDRNSQLLDSYICSPVINILKSEKSQFRLCFAHITLSCEHV